MSAGRRLLWALGAGLAVLAAALAVSPGLAERLGLAAALAGVANGYLLVAAVGVVALVYGFLVWLSWSAGGVEQAALPDVETATTGRVPGSELDDALPELAGERGRAARPVEHREWIRERLRTDAVETLARTHNDPPDAAAAAVEAGEWTDDRYAGAFLGGPDAPGPRWHQRLWNGLRRRDPFTHRVARTVDELDRLGGDR